MKNVSLINFRNKFSRVNAKKQISKHIKLILKLIGKHIKFFLWLMGLMAIVSAFKLCMKVYELSTVYYNSKMVLVLCNSLDVGLMMLELLSACVSVVILFKIYEYERK